MMTGCENNVGWMMRTGLSVSVRSPRSVASSEIPRRGSCGSCAGKKTDCGACGQSQRTFYDRTTRRVRDLSCGDTRVYLEFEVRRVSCRNCGAVKREHLPWLANNPFYTKRFAFYVGRRCRASTLRDVVRNSASIGKRSSRWRWSLCASNSDGPGRPVRRCSASTNSPSAGDTTTASSSATWSAAGRSGSEVRTDPRRAWLSSSSGWGRGNARGSAWPSWTCGSRSATPRSRRETRLKPGSCTTSFTSSRN